MRRSGSSHVGLLAIALVFAGGCSTDDLTQLIVVVDSDLSVPDDIDRVRVEIDGAGPSLSSDARLTGAGARPLPRILTLVHSDGPLGPIDVRAAGLLVDAEVVERRARVSFVKGRTVTLRLNLLRSCVGVTCGPDETCAANGCRPVAVPAAELVEWTGVVDPLDGSAPGDDAGVPPDGCTPAAELCNGADDDCDGMLDEGIDLTTDPMNCGSCGNACPADATATASCAGSACSFACVAGRGDCNGMADDFCETELISLTDCGACGAACDLENAMESCDTGTCTLGSCVDGFGDCDGMESTGCEAPLSTPTDCGTCGNACAPPTDLCSARGMSFTCTRSCPGGTTLCAMSCVDTRTDPLHCGGCGTACMTPARSMATCAGGTCGFTCDAGFDDCDSMAGNGCETSLTSLTDCGTCGTTCMLANAVESCAMGSCALVSCDAGFDDCDMTASNGCETSLSTVTDCGTCGTTCTLPNAMETCAGGMCALAGCDPGFDDCDMTASNGCEVPTTTLTDCGGCGVACSLPNATESCATGACAVTMCDPGFGDCDMTAGNGCEETLATSAMHCGACGNACAPTATCISGTCRGLTEVVAVDGGRAHTCGRQVSGNIVCWGDNAEGQLGDGTTSRRTSPVTTTGLTDAIHHSAGGRHSCAVRATGAVVCWGRNADGQLGDGSFSRRTTPTMVSGITDAAQVAAGDDHTCALRSTGQVVCWGRNTSGQLGTGSITGDRTTPQAVVGVANAIQISAGEDHTCVVRLGGQVTCWGENSDGQIGDGTRTDRPTPVDVSGLANATQVSGGRYHTCAVRTTGRAACWGRNAEGQLGTGSTSGDQTTPVAVMALTRVVEVAAGEFHTCARLATGAVECWGENSFGQLGDNSTSDSASPVSVVGITDAVAIGVGREHSCAARATGGVVCWGRGDDGQLGDGSTNDSDMPVTVSGIP